MVTHCLDSMKGKPLARLATNRKLRKSTLLQHEIGYNPITKAYIIPVWDENKKTLLNIRVYKDSKLMNTSGCNAVLYGLHELKKPHTSIWLTEGEWDKMAMWEMLKRVGIKDAVSVATPGANTFKGDWQYLFKNKIVHVAYDNDHDKVVKEVFRPGAGKAGCRKVREHLAPVVKQLDFVNWPKSYEDKFDVRDWYTKKKDGNAEKAMRGLVAMLKETPLSIIYPDGHKDVEDPTVEKDGPPALILDGKGLIPKDIYKEWDKWLSINDYNCLDVLYSTVIANRFCNDPVWLFFVGPSGSMKTDLVMALDGWDETFDISSLTPNTLMSGNASQNRDPSLIPKLDGKILTIKDYTTVLQMQQQSRDAIMAQLRDAYDGKCAKPYGTGVLRYYKSKFGFISAVTPVVEQFLEGGTAMGERFLTYPLKEIYSFDEISHIMDCVINNTLGQRKSEMREALSALSREVLNYDFGFIVNMAPDLRARLKALAFYVSRMRGTVTRDKFHRNEITHRAYCELPTRLVGQFVSLAAGITLFRRKQDFTDSEFQVMKHIAIGSVPHHEEKIIHSIWDEDLKGRYSTEDFADLLRLPWEVVHRFAENLVHLGMLRRKTRDHHRVDARYFLSKDAIKSIEISEIFKRR